MRTEPREITNSEDLIDSRDVIARIEALEDERDNFTIEDQPAASDLDRLKAWAAENPDEADELKALTALAEEAEGYAADWTHGETLIRESYFQTFAQCLAEDIGAIDANASWPNTCIDWDQAARELKMDYTAVDFDGVTYYVR